MNFRRSNLSQPSLPSAQEMQAISQEISSNFSTQNNNASELVILPVDPLHLYSYWNISNIADDDSLALVLRVYWLPEGMNDIEHSKLWFDTVLDKTQGQRKIKLPVDDTRYSAAVGIRDRQQNLDILIRSKSIETPIINAKPFVQQPQPVIPNNLTPGFQATVDQGDQIVLVTRLFYDENAIDSQIRETEFNKYQPKTGLRPTPTMATPKLLNSLQKSGHYDETTVDVQIRKTFTEKGLKFNLSSPSLKPVSADLHFAASNPSGQNNQI